MQQLTRDELAQFVARYSADIHEMTLGQFRDWLSARISETQHQPMFQQRCLIRDLKRAHRRRLRDRERRLNDARGSFERSPHASRYTELQHMAEGLEKAVEGLTEAVAAGRADPAKLAEFQDQLAENQRLQRELLSQLPERKRLNRAIESLENLRKEIGLKDAEVKLQELSSARGNSSVSAGGRFEKTSSRATLELILPEVASPEEQPVVLHGVTLGCARGEIDQMVVVPRRDAPVEVRAVVEAKRNINDLVHGFRQRQENLAWFAGDSLSYDPALYRTDRFRTGHFDEPAFHVEDGTSYHFEAESFHRYKVLHGDAWRLDRLYFVTEQRPLLGATSAELSRVMSRVATDPGFNIDRNAFLRRFHEWACEVIDRFQTRETLSLYADREDWARQIIFA